MNERQREYFRNKLLAWKDEIIKESKITLQTLQEENVNHPDLADRASSETDRAIERAKRKWPDARSGHCHKSVRPVAGYSSR